MSRGFARLGWPRGNELLAPADFVAHATPHTKGSWVEIDAAAANNVVGMWIASDVTIGVANTDTSMLMDIGIGAAASEVAVVANIPVGAHGGSVTNISKIPFFLPIHIPTGTRIAGRIQGAVTVDVYDPSINLVFGGRPGSWGGYSIAETIGVDIATSGPSTGDLADNAWDEAIASTANSYRALTFHTCVPPAVTAISATSVLVDIGVGGAGSEQVLGTWRVLTSSSEIITQWEGPPFIEVEIPAGSRLAIRKNGTTDLSAALIGWR